MTIACARDEVKAMALRYRREGMTIPEIADRFGVSERTVMRWLPKSEKREMHQPLSHEERRIVYQLHADECPIREIARTIGRSPRAVTRLVTPTWGRGECARLIRNMERIPNTIAEIRAMREKGLLR